MQQVGALGAALASMGGSDLETAAAQQMQQELFSQQQHQIQHRHRQVGGAGGRGGGGAAPPPSDSTRASSLPGTLRDTLQRAHLEQQMAQVAGVRTAPWAAMSRPLPSYGTSSGRLALAHQAESTHAIRDLSILPPKRRTIQAGAVRCQSQAEPVPLTFESCSYFRFTLSRNGQAHVFESLCHLTGDRQQAQQRGVWGGPGSHGLPAAVHSRESGGGDGRQVRARPDGSLPPPCVEPLRLRGSRKLPWQGRTGPRQRARRSLAYFLALVWRGQGPHERAG